MYPTRLVLGRDPYHTGVEPGEVEVPVEDSHKRGVGRGSGRTQGCRGPPSHWRDHTVTCRGQAVTGETERASVGSAFVGPGNPVSRPRRGRCRTGSGPFRPLRRQGSSTYITLETQGGEVGTSVEKDDPTELGRRVGEGKEKTLDHESSPVDDPLVSRPFCGAWVPVPGAQPQETPTEDRSQRPPWGL